MTADELREYFNHTYGATKKWPLIYKVDMKTYINVCQAIFEAKESAVALSVDADLREIHHLRITVGPNYGIIFKNVELVVGG